MTTLTPPTGDAGIKTPNTYVGESDAEKTQPQATVVPATGRQRITRKMGLMLLGLVIATVFIYVRSIYRTIEVRGIFVSGTKILFALSSVDLRLLVHSFSTDGTVQSSQMKRCSVSNRLLLFVIGGLKVLSCGRCARWHANPPGYGDTQCPASWLASTSPKGRSCPSHCLASGNGSSPLFFLLT